MSRDTIRLAAMYDSFEEYMVKQPQSYEEASYRKEASTVEAMFVSGEIARYRAGGYWNVGVDERLNMVQEPEEAPASAAYKPTRPYKATTVAERVDAYATLESLMASDPALVAQMNKYPYVDRLVRDAYATKPTELAIYIKANGCKNYDEFATRLPRHAAAAEACGFTAHLRDGEGTWAHRVSVRLWELADANR